MFDENENLNGAAAASETTQAPPAAGATESNQQTVAAESQENQAHLNAQKSAEALSTVNEKSQEVAAEQEAPVVNVPAATIKCTSCNTHFSPKGPMGTTCPQCGAQTEHQ